jgi:hypothetical protein
MTVKQATLVQQQNLFATVDMTTNTTTVYTGPVILVGIHVNIALDANACEIEQVAGTSVFTIAASTAAGTNINCFNMRLEKALIVNPADAAASGQITVVYRPVNPTHVDGLTVIGP